jgi:hypothetical protein
MLHDTIEAGKAQALSVRHICDAKAMKNKVKSPKMIQLPFINNCRDAGAL